MYKKSNIFTFSFLIVFFFFVNAQKESNIWYFGKNAGLDFNSGSPVIVTGSAMNTAEGCASMADRETGQLLFYTNGMNVWDKTHALMPSGNNTLWGHWSSTQSVIIIPNPANLNQYYLFNSPGGTLGIPNGGIFSWSLVDMSLNSGDGDVSILNVPLYDTVSEKQAAVRHANGCDYWSLSQRWNSDEIYAYLINSKGVDSNPVISATGYYQGASNASIWGQMKISPDGKKVTQIINYLSTETKPSSVLICDFDASTGIVSDCYEVTIFAEDMYNESIYGIEFSKDNTKIYVVGHSSMVNTYKEIFQIDMAAGNTNAIRSSVIPIGRVHNSSTFFPSSAQLAPDGKIYVALPNKDSLAIIEQPNVKGVSCGFRVNGIYLNGNRSDHGLPNFVASVFSSAMNANFTYVTGCLGDTTHFFDQSDFSANQWYWHFGDGRTDTISDPSYVYKDTGIFEVTLIAENSCLKDTVIKTIEITICEDQDTIPDIIGDTSSTDINFPREIFIPTAFSPDGNSINSIFKISGTGIKSAHLNIYDRWARKVFESADYHNGWDGTFKNNKLESGVYLYIFKCELINGKFIDMKGNVSIVY